MVKRWIAIGGAVVAVTVILVAIGVGGSGGKTVPASTLTEAAAATGEVRGYRVALEGEMSGGGVEVPVKATGVVDPLHRRGSMTTTMSGVPGIQPGSERLKLKQVFDGLVMYMRSPLFQRVPGAEDWVKFDIGRVQRQMGIALPQSGMSYDAAQTVDQIRAVSGRVEQVGHETIRGTRATHYRATMDLRRYPRLVPKRQRATARAAVEQLIEMTGTSKIPQDVWIDSRHLVRRIKFAYRMKIAQQPGGPKADVRLLMTQDLFDFGVPVRVEIPSDDEVTDITELAARGFRPQQ